MKFVRFCLVGGTVFIIDFALFNTLVKFIEHPYLARWVSFCLAIYCNWIGQTYFTFASRHHSPSNQPYQFSKFFVMSHGTGLLNLAAYSLAVSLGLALNVSFVIGVALSLFLNFIFAKKIITGNPSLKGKQ